MDSGNFLNIEPRETRDDPGKQRGEEFSGAKGSKAVTATWERPDNGEDEACGIVAIYWIRLCNQETRHTLQGHYARGTAQADHSCL